MENTRTFTFYDSENPTIHKVIGYFHVQYDTTKHVYCAYLIKNNKVKIIANSKYDIPEELKYYFVRTIPFHEMDQAIWNCFNNILINKLYVQHSFNADIIEVFGKIYPMNQYPEKKDIDMDIISDTITRMTIL